MRNKKMFSFCRRQRPVLESKTIDIEVKTSSKTITIKCPKELVDQDANPPKLIVIPVELNGKVRDLYNLFESADDAKRETQHTKLTYRADIAELRQKFVIELIQSQPAVATELAILTKELADEDKATIAKEAAHYGFEFEAKRSSSLVR